uniref:Glycosyltransferase family 92 protein n=1 Tax=Panagrellus redivivus TaxID=6233 RepID=A0A7E4ZUD4_PANRE
MSDLPSNITVPLELPSRKPRYIVACYAPMFYEQRWQAITMIHELNARWGVDLQVHYVQSVVGELMTLLDPMVKRGLLEFRGLDIPDLGLAVTKKYGYNPAQSTEARHQVMALQDCYFRYRESAEFIMVSDPDDLFVPHHGNDLYDEFSYWRHLHPMASAYIFRRNISYITTSSKLEDFSVSKTLNSIKIGEMSDVGKSVYNPKYAETPWIHWPGLKKSPVFEVPESESYAIHLKYNFDEPPTISEPTKKITEVIDLSAFNNPTFINYTEARNNITDLPSSSLDYSDLITTCRMKLHTLYQIPELVIHAKVCTTITSCEIPKRDVNCTIAVRSYRTVCLPGNQLCAILPNKVLPDFVNRSDGCAWGITV